MVFGETQVFKDNIHLIREGPFRFGAASDGDLVETYEEHVT